MEEPSIVPPPDVRNIIIKTVGVVRQSDESTARKLLITKPKLFSFLNPADPFHPWYQWRLQTYSEEPATTAPETPVEEPIISVDPLRFSAHQPALSSKDLQVIKLTALYTAKDPAFAKSLPTEGQFAFLDPEHSLNSLYTAFIDQFNCILDPPADVLARLDPNDDILERATKRAQYMQQVQKSVDIEQTKAEKDRIEFAQIDWQDFVVVETVVFAEDEQIEHRPLRKEDVQIKRLAPKQAGSEVKLRSAYTGEMIAASEFDEHMRIMNLDPTWKQQREVAQQRQASTNLDLAHAAANLKRFMSSKNEGPRKRR